MSMKLRMYGETAKQCNTTRCAARCNTLQHAATRVNTPQHATIRCNTQNIRRLTEYEEIKSVWTSHLYSHKRALCIRKRALYIHTRAVLFRKELYISAKEPHAASKVPYTSRKEPCICVKSRIHPQKCPVYPHIHIWKVS